MQVEPELTFHNYQPSAEVTSEVARQLERLQKFSGRITSCRVAIHGPQTRHRHGEVFKVNLRIAMPQHEDIVVTRSHDDLPENAHPLVAVRNAFAAAQRQIEDAAREMRGQVKVHRSPDVGRVARFLAGEDCGFIETADGREVYFHRNAVLGDAFDKLAEGSKVRFVEEEGERGPQASTVRIVDHLHRE